MKKTISRTLLAIVMICELTFINVNLGMSQDGLITVISSDTTWTKADSPYSLTGHLLVSKGVTLTIEAGTTVNLNGYEIRVNGTLVARGIITDPIHFNDGTITFTEYSEGWNEQTGSGSIIEHSLLDNVEISSSVTVKINDHKLQEDTTWTKANSPYSLAGPLLVSKGVTLTIEAGTTVNLNGNDVLVKGTLRAIGNSANSIDFTDGSITFDTESNGWNEQTESGSIIEQSFLHSLNVFTDVPVKISNNKMMNVYIEGDSLLILDNEEVFLISVCGASSIRGNTLRAITIRGGSAVISNNTVQHVVISDGSPEISNNTIEKIFGSRGSPVISGNTIRGGISLDCETAIVSNNTISGYSFEYSYEVSQGLFRPMITVNVTVTTSGIIVRNGSAYVSGNTIRNCKIGIEGVTTIVENVLCNCSIGIKGGTTIVGNVLHNCSIGIEGGRTIGGNVLVNNHKGIAITEDKVTIRNNNITKGDTGISGHTKGEVTIENNIISSQSSYGIEITSKAIIRNNTLTNNGYITIRLDSCPSAKINYNNIENCNGSSIYLINTTANIDATNNWWGTVDTQTINLTIHDSKYDFDLGKVTFVPLLTEANSQAIPAPESYIEPQPELDNQTILIAASVMAVIISLGLAVYFIRRK